MDPTQLERWTPIAELGTGRAGVWSLGGRCGFARVGGDAFATIDAGRTWSSVMLDGPGWAPIVGRRGLHARLGLGPAPSLERLGPDGAWERAPWPDPAPYRATRLLEVDPLGRLWLFTERHLRTYDDAIERAGWRSDDGGGSWSPLAFPLPDRLWFGADGAVYAVAMVAAGKLSRLDGGAWRSLRSPAYAHHAYVDSAGRLFAATTDHVHVSRDGADWKRIGGHYRVSEGPTTWEGEATGFAAFAELPDATVLGATSGEPAHGVFALAPGATKWRSCSAGLLHRPPRIDRLVVLGEAVVACGPTGAWRAGFPTERPDPTTLPLDRFLAPSEDP